MNTPPRKKRPASLGAEARSAKAAAGPSDGDTNMTRTYVGVVILEAIIVFAFWLLGRAFS